MNTQPYLFELRKKTVICPFNYQFWKNNWIGAQQIGSKYEDMVFIDWYTFWKSDPVSHFDIINAVKITVFINSSIGVYTGLTNSAIDT